jgi:ATP-binding protein involved in chromosome partitioning
MSNNNYNYTEIKKFLETIYLGENKQNLVKSGILSSLNIDKDILNVVIEFPQELVIDQESITNKINKIIAQNFPNLKDVRVIFSSKRIADKSIKNKQHIANVKKIILLASAKGGVGKSTTAANLAIALSSIGYKVGIVDADIYGPTIPKLLGINQKPEIVDNKMIPIKKYGVHSISIGYLVEDSQAAIWRGPMITKALYQLLVGVKWPEIDYLIIDMPPGTGDIYLSLAENFYVDGVVLITTPQHIALNMLKKSLSFFNKTNIPIIGVIENMSYFFDEENNITHNIFGKSLTSKEIEDIGTSLIAQIALVPKISKYSDNGLSLLEEKEFAVYKDIAKKVDKWHSD